MVHSMGEVDPAQRGMSTTASVVQFVGRVGDSRFYLARNGEVTQLTPDSPSWEGEGSRLDPDLTRLRRRRRARRPGSSGSFTLRPYLLAASRHLDDETGGQSI